MYNHTDRFNLSYNYEGTGRSHDQQYDYYEYCNTGLHAHRELGNIVCQVEVQHDNMTSTYTSWWTRSFCSFTKYQSRFYTVLKYGDRDFVKANEYAGIVPAFAF
jgi:hypothetical protein